MIDIWCIAKAVVAAVLEDLAQSGTVSSSGNNPTQTYGNIIRIQNYVDHISSIITKPMGARLHIYVMNKRQRILLQKKRFQHGGPLAKRIWSHLLHHRIDGASSDIIFFSFPFAIGNTTTWLQNLHVQYQRR